MTRKIIPSRRRFGRRTRGSPSFDKVHESACQTNVKTPFWRFLPLRCKARLPMAALGLFLLMTLGGCLTSMAPTAKMKEEVHASEDLAVNMQQVRVRMRTLVEPFSAVIAVSADRIMEKAPNRDVRREALLFKLQAVPAMREALFRPHPFNAILDSWVLSWQLADYFATGRGRTVMGDGAPDAAATCRHLESRIETVVASMTHSGDVSDVRTFTRQWALEHPIDHSIAGRESTVSLVTEAQLQETFSTMEVAGSLAITADDLVRRLDVYSDQLLNESRWQAELFVMDMARQYQTEELFYLAQNAVQIAGTATKNADRLLPQLEAALAAAESAPDMVARERAAAVDALSQEMSRSLDFIRGERASALAHLTRERQAALTELRQVIETEHLRLSAEMASLGENLLDNAFRRAIQLAAGVLIVLFLSLLVLLLVARHIFSYSGQRAS